MHLEAFPHVPVLVQAIGPGSDLRLRGTRQPGEGDQAARPRMIHLCRPFTSTFPFRSFPRSLPICSSLLYLSSFFFILCVFPSFSYLSFLLSLYSPFSVTLQFNLSSTISLDLSRLLALAPYKHAHAVLRSICMQPPFVLPCRSFH